MLSTLLGYVLSLNPKCIWSRHTVYYAACLGLGHLCHRHTGCCHILLLAAARVPVTAVSALRTLTAKHSRLTDASSVWHTSQGASWHNHDTTCCLKQTYSSLFVLNPPCIVLRIRSSPHQCSMTCTSHGPTASTLYAAQPPPTPQSSSQRLRTSPCIFRCTPVQQSVLYDSVMHPLHATNVPQ